MRNILSPPEFAGRSTKNRAARLLNAVLWSVIVAVVVYSIAMWTIGQSVGALSILLILLPVCAFLISRIHGGHVRSSALLLVFLIWTIIVAAALMAGGVTAPAYGGLVIPIVISGIVLRRRYTIVIVLLSALAGYLMLISDLNGLASQQALRSAYAIWISQLLFFVIVAVVTFVAADIRDRMIGEMQESESLALEANRRLESEIESRIKVEEELRFHANILDQVSDAIIVTNAQHEIIYWNQGAEHLFGLAGSLVNGKLMDEVIDFKTPGKGWGNGHQPHADNGLRQSENLAVVKATGKEVLVESRSSFLPEQNQSQDTMILSTRDIRLRVEAEEKLAYRSELQQVVTQLAISFVNLITEDVDDGINDALQTLGEFFDVERCLIARFSNRMSTMSVSYEFCRSEVPSMLQSHQNIPTERVSWLINMLRRFEIVNIEDIDCLPPEAEETKSNLREAGVGALLAVPLIQNQNLVGFLGFSQTDKKRVWAEDIVNQLLVVGQIIVNVLERQTYEENLQTQAAQLNDLANRLSVLHDLDQLIFSAQSLTELASHTLSRLYELTDCKCNSIFLVDDDHHSGYYFANHPAQQHPMFDAPVPLSSIDYIDELRDGTILLHENVQEYEAGSTDRIMAEMLGVQSAAHIPLMVRSTLVGILHLGFEQPEAVVDLSIDVVGNVASSLSLAIANTQLYDQVQAHAQELSHKVAERTSALERQYHLQSGLARIELAINQPSELQEVLDQIVHVTTECLPADIGVSVILWDDVEQAYVSSSTSVVDQPSLQAANRVRKRGGATRWIIEHAQPLLVEDAINDPLGPNPMIREYGVGSYAGMPLLIEGKPIGVLYALRSQSGVFAHDEVEFLTTVASRAAVAVTKVRLFEQAQVLAAEEERQRIARDLHDVVSQSLFSASVIAESLPRLLDHNPDLVRSGLEDLHEMTRGTLAEMRTLLFELRPKSLAETEISELFSQLTAAFTGRTRIPVELNVDSHIDLPPSQQIGIYRILQESLNNISRHAQAENVLIDLESTETGYMLCIRDDGIGFDPDEIPNGHFGVHIMRERAEEMKANLSIESYPDSGTTITLTRDYG